MRSDWYLNTSLQIRGDTWTMALPAPAKGARVLDMAPDQGEMPEPCVNAVHRFGSRTVLRHDRRSKTGPQRFKY